MCPQQSQGPRDKALPAVSVKVITARESIPLPGTSCPLSQGRCCGVIRGQDELWKVICGTLH